MHSSVFVTVGRQSAPVYYRSTAAMAAGGFHASRRYQSTAVGVVHVPVLSSKCGQCHIESQQ